MSGHEKCHAVITVMHETSCGGGSQTVGVSAVGPGKTQQAHRDSGGTKTRTDNRLYMSHPSSEA